MNTKMEKAKEKFFSYIYGEYRNEKGTGNLLTNEDNQYYLCSGHPVEYSKGKLGNVNLFGITVIYAGSMVNNFSACFTREYQALSYLQCLLDGGIIGSVKGENIAISCKNHYLKQIL